MDRIIPGLWFDKNALEAAEFYASLFEGSQINRVNYYYDELFPSDFEGVPMPENTVLDVDFTLGNQRFSAVNGGPIFHPNPSISFYVVCDSVEHLDGLHKKLLPGGHELMALGAYPFSQRYCWIEDRFGISWQLIVSTGEEALDIISPCLLFVGEENGRAEEAINFYSSLFESSGIESVSRYGEGEGGNAGTISHAAFHLGSQSFIAMDSSLNHSFTFSEGISLMVPCSTQEEIDFLWGELTRAGEEQPCGWLKDKFGVSWQIIPEALSELADQTDLKRASRVNRALLKMRKIDIKTLKDAYDGV